MKRSAVKHPLLFSILVVLIFEISMLAVTMLIALFAPSFFITNGDFVLQGTVEAFLSLIAIGTVALFGYNSIWNEWGTGFVKGLATGAYFLVVSLIALVSSLVEGLLNSHEFEPGWKIAVFTVCVFLIGLCEETFFRGVVANLFYDRFNKDPAGIWCATLWSGVVFGLMHSMNAFGAEDTNTIIGVAVQVFSACAMGMTLSAIYFRCRNIWALVFIHGFVDFGAAFSAGCFKGGSLSDTIGSYTPDMCLSALIYVAVTAILLRPKKMKEIIDYERTKRGLPIHDGKVISAPASKKSLTAIIIISVVIALVLYGGSSWLYATTTPSSVMDYSDVETFDALTEKTVHADDISVYASGNYRLTIRSYPANSKAYATVTISDGETEIFSETYGGRCSETAWIYLEAGKTYSVDIHYDYSAVTTEAELHEISIIIE